MTAGVRVASLLDKGLQNDERWFRVVKSNLGHINEKGWTWRFAWPDPFADGASDMPHIEWSEASEEYDGLSAERQAGRAPTLGPEIVQAALSEVLAAGPRSLSSAIDLAWAKLRKANSRVKKSEVELAIGEVAREGLAVDAWEGPRGAKLIGLPGTKVETPEAKAYRLAHADSSLSVRVLKALAGCGTDTAIEALRDAKEHS
jgi:hypothetical protein